MLVICVNPAMWEEIRVKECVWMEEQYLGSLLSHPFFVQRKETRTKVESDRSFYMINSTYVQSFLAVYLQSAPLFASYFFSMCYLCMFYIVSMYLATPVGMRLCVRISLALCPGLIKEFCCLEMCS
uniref:Uncharacterized protein n=1 Tax=Trypanosoma congolense (strain IL3000) TaxID=1068625 RepID=G0UTR2_TRYCI|nr:hypothetical protein, unlikely [Trypanosoma congolense IL3000]